MNENELQIPEGYRVTSHVYEVTHILINGKLSAVNEAQESKWVPSVFSLGHLQDIGATFLTKIPGKPKPTFKTPAMRVIATPVKGRDLMPGELFSTLGPEYWEEIDSYRTIGERVYLRTNTPTPSIDVGDQDVFRIQVVAHQGGAR